MRYGHEDGAVCMSVAMAKKIVCGGVSTDTRFVSHPALVASADRKHLIMRLNLNALWSILMRGSLPFCKFVLHRVPGMSGHLTVSPERRLLQRPRSGGRVHDKRCR